MHHLLSTRDLSSDDIETLIQRALTFKNAKACPAYSHVKAASLFYEPSTRTFMSFALAAQNLNIQLIPLSMQHSSEKKGESFEDTLQNLNAMGLDLLVIRHPQSHIFDQLPNLPLHIINAGDGQNEHPSQALLDLMTIQEVHANLQTLRIAIVGDIKHSRVAHSFQYLCKTMNMQPITLIAPELWQSPPIHGHYSDSLAEGLKNADVIMTLRVQCERIEGHEQLSLETYQEHYAINAQMLKHAKPNAMVLHPGPINRNIELSTDVADGPQSYVLTQVNNGVFMRMAILEKLLSHP